MTRYVRVVSTKAVWKLRGEGSRRRERGEKGGVVKGEREGERVIGIVIFRFIFLIYFLVRCLVRALVYTVLVVFVFVVGVFFRGLAGWHVCAFEEDQGTNNFL